MILSTDVVIDIFFSYSVISSNLMFFQVDHTKRWPLPRRVACGSFMIKWKGNGNSAKCKLCQKSIKSCGNTTNLIGHIRNVHKLAYRELFNESSNNSNIDNNK